MIITAGRSNDGVQNVRCVFVLRLREAVNSGRVLVKLTCLMRLLTVLTMSSRLFISTKRSEPITAVFRIHISKEDCLEIEKFTRKMR